MKKISEPVKRHQVWALIFLLCAGFWSAVSILVFALVK